MNTSELLKQFQNVNYHFSFDDVGQVFFENLCLQAELTALRKYTVRQFLGLNGGDSVLEIDEEKSSMLEQEHKIIDEYYDEVFRELFADFVAKYGKIQ